jgi:hypothetical protein
MTGNAIGGLIFAVIGGLLLVAIVVGWYFDDHPHWTVEHRTVGHQYLDPFNQPEFWSRRRAERYVRRHTCQHHTYVLKRIVQCGRHAERVDAPPRPSTPDPFDA